MYLESFIIHFFELLNVVAIYIMLGLLIAGILKQLIPDSFIKKHLGSNSKIAVIKASILGIPLPLCSCSVIPFAQSLKKSGASKSALQSFLISTPITGLDSILASYSAFGIFFAIYRVITSFIIAVSAGLISILFDKEENQQPTIKFNSFSKTVPINKISCRAEQNKQINNFWFNVWDYAFNNLFKDIAKPLLIGLVLGSLVMVIFPTNIQNYLTQNLAISYILMIAISLPLYVCATSSIPLGISFLMIGFSPGSVFVFLSAGPATSLLSFAVIKNILGKKGLFIYIFSIAFLSILFGYIIDILIPNIINLSNIIVEDENNISFLSFVSSFVMVVLLFKALLPNKKNSCGCH